MMIMSFHVHLIRRHIKSVGPTVSEAKFDHLVKVVPDLSITRASFPLKLRELELPQISRYYKGQD